MYLVSKVVKLVFPFLHTCWSIHLGLTIRKRKKSSKFNVTKLTPQMVPKCLTYPTSGGQTHDQEAAVQWTERSSFSYLLALMVRTQCSASLPVLLQLHQTQTATLALQK